MILGSHTRSLPYRPNITRANNFGLGLSALGQLTLSSNMNADGIVDVSGYYSYPAPTWTLTLRDEADRLSTDYTVTSSTITRTKNYFHFGNLLVSTRDAGGAYAYYGSDHLGTPRLVTGALSESHTYHPFGQEITPLFGNQPLKFAAMERDQASGNDQDHARVCATSTLGRFLTVDLLGGIPEDPQSWNRYTYALDNPLKYTDPTGLIRVTVDAKPCNMDLNCAEFTQQERITVSASPDKISRGTFAFLAGDFAALIGVASQFSIRDPAGPTRFARTVLDERAGQEFAFGSSVRGGLASIEASQLPTDTPDLVLMFAGGIGEKKAVELIPGSLKRARSYASELEHLTKRELGNLARQGNQKATKMLELIKEARRLLEK